MYKEAYSLLREILNDEELNNYIFESTGKYLTVIDAGAKVTTPAVSISLSGGSSSRRSNTKAEVDYLLSFALPYFGDDGFEKCLDFLDFLMPVIFEYRRDISFVKTASPSITEQDGNKDIFVIDINLTVEVLS